MNMNEQLSGKMRDEVDLIARFAETYRRRFSNLIDRMNHAADPATELASLRLCVEAVDMMLSNQKQLAKALCEITQDIRVKVNRPIAA
jgi:phosphoenolpyruvate carboxylase